jgi:transaldolase
MIKVPATDAGIVAIKALVESGINVNVTLIFTPARYRQVLDAFIAGTENRVALVSERGDQSPTFAHSVASFFVSRTDAALQTRLESVADGVHNYRVASALALLCYEIYEQAKQSDRWQALADVRPPLQRLLWASVAPKNPSVDPLIYVNNLCLPETVITLPQATLDALMAAPADTKMTPLTIAQAHEIVDAVVASDIDLLQLGMGLEDQGLEQFAESFDTLLEALAKKAAQ